LKPRLKAFLVAIVIAPLCLLSYLGIKVSRDEQEMMRIRFDELLLSKLADFSAAADKVVEKQKRELLRITDLASLDAETLRAVVNKERIVRQMFAVDADGTLIHPPSDGTASEAEKSFLLRTRRVFGGKGLFSGGEADSQASKKGSTAIEADERDSGFYVWYWDEGVSILFWRRLSAGRVIGAELSRVVLLSDIIAELPESKADKAAAAQGWVELVDANGKPVYGWGRRLEEKERALRVSLPLHPPLGAWKLMYFTEPNPLGESLGKNAFINVLFGIGTLGLALIGLAYYIFRESAREIFEAKTRVNFVNQVSHELKTPLTNIRMYAELLEERLDDEDEKSLSYAGIIANESQRLSRLIANVLTFSRKQRDVLSVRRRTAVVDDVIDRVLKQFEPSFSKKGITASFSRGAGAETQVDTDALDQILANLLSNVEKYAAKGRSVEIATEAQGDNIIITVADRGDGVSRSLKEKIFEPFYRVSASLTEGVSGTGIGLGISRELARAHGGDLTLEPSLSGALFKVVLDAVERGERQ
jgi:signal transduction histidine kinase